MAPRVSVRLVALAGAFAVIIGSTWPSMPPLCLDVAVPEGSSVDWDRALFSPTVINWQRPPAPDDRGDGRGTVEFGGETRARPALQFPGAGHHQYYSVITFDITNHIRLREPSLSEAPPDDPGRIRRQNQWPPSDWERVPAPGAGVAPYPPPMPAELVWDGVFTGLRAVLHPDEISVAGAVCHVLTIGEPAVAGLIGAANPDDRFQALPDLLMRAIDQIGLVPSAPPVLPLAEEMTEREKSLIRLAVTELCGGYPYAYDPNYCRRLLMLGPMALPAIITCTRADHRLLRRNATAMMGAFPAHLAGPRLRELAADLDPVVAIRAIRALIRYGDPANTEMLRTMADSPDPVRRTLAMEGIGYLGNAELVATWSARLQAAISFNDTDELWRLLPALVRCGSDSAPMRLVLERVQRFLQAQFAVPDPNNIANRVTRTRVFWEMALFAQAAHHDPAARRTLFALDPTTHVRRFNWFLYVDTLARIGNPDAKRALKSLVAKLPEQPVAAYAVRALGDLGGEWDFLVQCAQTGPNPLLRGEAVVAAAKTNPAAAAPWCQTMFHAVQIPSDAQMIEMRDARIRELQRQIGRPVRPNELHPETMFHQTTAQMELHQITTSRRLIGVNSRESHAFLIHAIIAGATRHGPLSPAMAQQAVRRHFAHGHFAHRVAPQSIRDMPSVTVFPPLVEVAIAELTRTADASALPILLDILHTRHPLAAPQAALALGYFPSRASAFALVEALQADDPWLRFCAAMAFERICGETADVDWFVGPEPARQTARQSFLRWLSRHYPN